MESRQFYMTLPSNSSMDIFNSNKLSDFKVKLPSHMNLDGNWEVGLASITFPRTWYNITEANRRFYFDGGNDFWRVGLLPLGYYSSVQKVFDNMKKQIDDESVTGISFKFDELSQKVTVELAAKKKIMLPKDLGVMLGFEKELILSKSTTAPSVYDLNNGLQSLFIYLNIVESRVVGDVLAPLIRTVPAKGKDGEIIAINYDNPHYVPVATKDFEILEVLITSDTGEKIPFQRGRVVLTLHFRLRRSPFF